MTRDAFWMRSCQGVVGAEQRNVVCVVVLLEKNMAMVQSARLMIVLLFQDPILYYINIDRPPVFLKIYQCCENVVYRMSAS